MRVVRLRQAAQYQGYHITGEKKGEARRVDPSRDTHTSWTAVSLPCSRFRTVRGPWEKAVGDLARLHRPSPGERRVSQTRAAKHVPSSEEIRLRSLLEAELKRLREQRASNPHETERPAPTVMPPTTNGKTD